MPVICLCQNQTPYHPQSSWGPSGSSWPSYPYPVHLLNVNGRSQLYITTQNYWVRWLALRTTLSQPHSNFIPWYASFLPTHFPPTTPWCKIQRHQRAPGQGLSPQTARHSVASTSTSILTYSNHSLLWHVPKHYQATAFWSIWMTTARHPQSTIFPQSAASQDFH